MDKIGHAFPESITTGKNKRRNYNNNGKLPGMRNFIIPGILIIGVCVVLFRLFFIQVVQGSYYKNLSDGNRIKTIIIHAPRGTIFDRNGKPLVFNTPGFREVKDEKIKLLTNEEAIKLLANGEKNLEIDSLRDYPHKDSMGHVLGYLGQLSPEDLKKEEYKNYIPTDLVGKMGIEAQYEDFLKGQDGKQLVEINSMGEHIRKLGETDPIPGRNITLTIDLDLQKTAYKEMGSVKKGAVVATTPRGEVLALVSKPSFDPNLFTQGESYKIATSSGYQSASEILNDSSNQPFLNRAISGLYPPGSTFKIITSAAGLQNDIIDTKYIVKDTGVVKIGEFSFANWFFTNYGRTDGDVNVVKGIARSNDIFFYKLAEKVGLTRLSRMADDFGAGKVLGIDLPGEAKGNVPTDAWKRKVIGEQWYLGDTFHYGIGQGYLLSTPLEVNAWSQIIAANGTLYKPYLLKDMGDEILNKNFLDKKTIDPIRAGMRDSCSAGGVAFSFFDFKVKNKNLKIDGKNFFEVPAATTSAGFEDYRKISVACKTGTAQQGGEKDLPHSWITLFAPAHDPEIVLTVLAEESGEGSQVAGPIATKILTEYFKNKK